MLHKSTAFTWHLYIQVHYSTCMLDYFFQFDFIITIISTLISKFHHNNTFTITRVRCSYTDNVTWYNLYWTIHMNNDTWTICAYACMIVSTKKCIKNLRIIPLKLRQGCMTNICTYRKEILLYGLTIPHRYINEISLPFSSIIRLLGINCNFVNTAPSTKWKERYAIFKVTSSL